jgi:copper chaperone
MSETITYLVQGMTCAHCEAAVKETTAAAYGVSHVTVDLERNTVTVEGEGLDDRQLRRAIEEAGYQIS